LYVLAGYFMSETLCYILIKPMSYSIIIHHFVSLYGIYIVFYYLTTNALMR